MRTTLTCTLLFALAAGALWACGGSAPAPATPATPEASSAAAPAAAPKAIPHDLAGKDDCQSCHKLGGGPPMGMPDNHKGRENSACQSCHKAAAK
jgi:hypothetical protein